MLLNVHAVYLNLYKSDDILYAVVLLNSIAVEMVILVVVIELIIRVTNCLVHFMRQDKFIGYLFPSFRVMPRGECHVK